MKNKVLLLSLTSLLSLFATLQSAASHLMGGSLNYTYISFNSATQTATYDVVITMYRRCDAGSSNFTNTVNLGAYIENTSNVNKALFSSVVVGPVVTSPVVLPSGGGCSFNPNVCVEKGVYSTTISLPFQAQGYYLIADQCCRNTQIVNLNATGNNVGMSFYAYVPPAFVNNSSPTFVDAPVPYICVNDTTSLLNSVIDPDGDLLTYTFVTPFISLTGNANPPSPNPYPFPIRTATYTNSTFSVAEPFGTGGLASINGATGLTAYSPPALGLYVVAVEIKEFRGTNPNPIGITRRDLQIIVISCPANNSPNQAIDIDSNSVISTYNIRAGQNICFNIGFSDPTDSLFLSATGDIFNGSITNPPATFTNDSGLQAVSSQFCWNSACTQAGTYQFFVRAYDNGCPRKTLNAVYTINVAPIVPDAISGAVSVCAQQKGVAYSVPAISGATFNWNVTGGTLISGNGTNAIVVDWGNGPAGNVSYTQTNDLNCVSSAVNFAVNINALPAANAGNNRPLCNGSSTQLGAASSPGFSYSWAPATALSSTIIANPNANPTLTTTYIVTMTNNSNGCVNKDTVVVTVNNKPVVNAGADKEICIGSSTSIGGAPTGPLGSSFVWTNANGLNDATLANPSASPTVLTQYKVTVTDANNCVNTDSMVVTVNALPTVDAGIDKTTCNGSIVSLGGSPTGPSGATFVWTPALGLNNAGIANPTANPGASTVYKVTVTDTKGCINRDSAEVKINALPNVTAGSDKTICFEQNIVIGGAPTATGTVTYLWNNAGSLNDPSLSNPTANPQVTTTYIVTVTDSNGCAGTDTVSVNVNQLPITNAGNDKAICIGSSTSIGGAPTGPIGSVFSWNTSQNLSDSTLANPIVNPTVFTTYVVKVTDLNGCVNHDTINININALPIANAGGPSTVICAGDTTNIGLISIPNGNTYSWSPAIGLAVTNASITQASPANSITYTLTVTDVNTCQNTDTILVSVNPLPGLNGGIDKTICLGQNVEIGLAPTPGNSYLWTPAASLSSATVSAPTANPTITTSYLLTETITSTGCFSSDSVQVIVNELPAASVVPDDTICFGTTINLGAVSVANHTYLWSPTTGLNQSTIANPTASPLVQTTYTLVETNTLTGCVDSNTVTISLNAIGSATAGLPQTICRNDSAQIGAPAVAGSIYSWLPIAGLSDPTSANPKASPAATTTYTLTETILATGCQNTNTVTVTVNQLPPANAGVDLYLCPSPGNSVFLNASGGVTFSWSPTTNLSDPNIANPSANPDTTTNYIVLVTDTNGCQASDTVEVLVFPIVPVDAGFNKTICLKDSVILGGIQTAPPGSTFQWLPVAGLNDPTLGNPTASPSVTTTYIIRVLNDTCRGADTVTVFVNPIPAALAGNSRNLCINDSTTIGGAEVIGNTYSWSSNPAGFSSSISNPTVKPSVTTTYIVTETITATGCFKIDSMTVTVLPLPIVSAGTDKTICIGSPVAIGGSPTGPAGSTYVWSPGAGLSNATIANPNASPVVTSTYIVKVTDSNTCVNRDTVVVNVNPLPIVSAGGDLQLCINDTISIGGVPTGPLNSTYSWSPASSLVNATVSNPLALPTITTNYIVTVTDTNGCVNKDTMTVNVNVLPVVNAGANRSICFTDSTLLGGSPIAVNSSFSWTPLSGLGSATMPMPFASPAITTDYILTVTDNLTTCVNSDTVRVEVLPLPGAITGPAVPICIGDSIQIGSAAVLTNTYVWTPSTGLSNDSISNPFANPTVTTTYVLKETNTLTGCFKIDSVVVTVNPLPLATVTTAQTICLLQTVLIGAPAVAGNTYSWTPASGLTNATDANPGASPAVTTTYVLTETISATGCFKKDSVLVNVNPLPAADGGANKAICFGKSIQIGNPAVAGNTYLWTPGASLSSDVISDPIANPTSTTDYLLTETITITGCQKQDTVTVTVNPLPVIVTSGNSGVCSTDSINLSASGGSTYLWSPSTGLSNVNISNPKASPSDTITYKVIVTTSFGCVDSTTIDIDVNPLPVASATIEYTPNCDGLKAVYTNTSSISNNENLSYVWNFGDGSGSTSESPEHTFDYGQIYTTNLTVTSQNNCKSDTTIINDVLTQKDNVKITLANVITPNGDGVNDCYYYKADGDFNTCSELWVYNRWGKEIFKSDNSDNCWDGKDKNGNVVENGVYFYVYKIQDFKVNGSVNVYY